MQCKKCHAVLPEGSIFCCFCGKKQTASPKKRTRKRAAGTGTISKNPRCRNNPYIVRAPATPHGTGRVYIGSYPDMVSAQTALEAYIRNGRPALYNATLEDIFELWSNTHYKHVSESAVNLYDNMWKRFDEIKSMKMINIRTIHFQEIVNKATSKSSAEILKVLAKMLCAYAIENDIIGKNYAEFVKLPKFEKTEKVIFTDEQIAELWQHSDDRRVQAILVMIYMGFRIGELVNVRPSNIHFEEGYVIAGEKTEAGKDRIIPFPPEIPEITDFFRKWVQTSDETLLGVNTSKFRRDYFYGTLIELGLVNATPKGGGFEFADKKHLTPHSTRHTFASLSARAGMRPEELQKIIGHANYAVTANVYIHKDLNALKNAMSTLKKPDSYANCYDN